MPGLAKCLRLYGESLWRLRLWIILWIIINYGSVQPYILSHMLLTVIPCSPEQLIATNILEVILCVHVTHLRDNLYNFTIRHVIWAPEHVSIIWDQRRSIFVKLSFILSSWGWGLWTGYSTESHQVHNAAHAETFLSIVEYSDPGLVKLGVRRRYMYPHKTIPLRYRFPFVCN